MSHARRARLLKSVVVPSLSSAVLALMPSSPFLPAEAEVCHILNSHRPPQAGE